MNKKEYKQKIDSFLHAMRVEPLEAYHREVCADFLDEYCQEVTGRKGVGNRTTIHLRSAAGSGSASGQMVLASLDLWAAQILTNLDWYHYWQDERGGTRAEQDLVQGKPIKSVVESLRLITYAADGVVEVDTFAALWDLVLLRIDDIVSKFQELIVKGTRLDETYLAKLSNVIDEGLSVKWDRLALEEKAAEKEKRQAI